MRESDRRFCRENDIKWIQSDTFTILGVVFNKNMSNMEEDNFRPKLSKMKNLIRTWQGRNLTPLGILQLLNRLCSQS